MRQSGPQSRQSARTECGPHSFTGCRRTRRRHSRCRGEGSNASSRDFTSSLLVERGLFASRLKHRAVPLESHDMLSKRSFPGPIAQLDQSDPFLKGRPQVRFLLGSPILSHLSGGSLSRSEGGEGWRVAGRPLDRRGAALSGCRTITVVATGASPRGDRGRSASPTGPRPC